MQGATKLMNPLTCVQSSLQVCQDNTQATRLLRHAGGAEALAAQLRNTQLAESSQPQLLLAAVASALQAAVLPGAKSCARLLVAGGMQALLDLLAAGNRLQRPLLLSLLSDLLQQPAAADYFHEWRAGPAASGRNAVQLVLEIWRVSQQHECLRCLWKQVWCACCAQALVAVCECAQRMSQRSLSPLLPCTLTAWQSGS